MNLWARARGSSGSSMTSLFWTNDFKNAKCMAAAKRFMEILAFFSLDTMWHKDHSSISWMFDFFAGPMAVFEVSWTTTFLNFSITFTQSPIWLKHWEFEKGEQRRNCQKLTYWDGACWYWWPWYRYWVGIHPFNKGNYINKVIPHKYWEEETCTHTTHCFQWKWLRSRCCIVELDSQNGLHLIVLCIWTRSPCEEGYLAFVESGKKELVFKMSWLAMGNIQIKCKLTSRLSPPTFKAEHGYRSTKVTSGYTHRNTYR